MKIAPTCRVLSLVILALLVASKAETARPCAKLSPRGQSL